MARVHVCAVSSVILVTLAVLGCREPLGSEQGTLVLGLSESAPPLDSADEARVYLDDAYQFTLSRGEGRVIPGVPPGVHRIFVEAFAATTVDWTGVAVVEVFAGDTTEAVPAYSAFQPSLQPIATPSRSVRTAILFSAVENASSYQLRIDNSDQFLSPDTLSWTDTSGVVTVANAGQNFIQVRATTQFGNPGAWSNTESFTLVPSSVVVSPDSVRLSALSDTVTLSAQAFDDTDNLITGLQFRWTVDTTIATVNGGFVTTNDPGLVHVIAITPGGLADTARLFIEPFSATINRAVGLAYGDMLGLYSLVTDELDWGGASSEFQAVDQGNPQQPLLGTALAASRRLVSAQRLADRIKSAAEDRFNGGRLADPLELPRVLIVHAVTFMTIADMFDRWSLNDSTVVETSSMGELYDTALVDLTKALVHALVLGDLALAQTTRAFRARAQHALAVWQRVGVLPVDTTGMGLVSVVGAIADAQEAGVPADWTFGFSYSASDEPPAIATWVNVEPPEMLLGRVFATGRSATILDPIDSVVSPVVAKLITEFAAAGERPALYVVSARELSLIIAEGFLASADTASFVNEINRLRALDGLKAYSPSSAIPPAALLRHARQTNLYLQGRRLSDLYRFGLRSPDWLPSSAAVVRPGTFFELPPR